VPHQKPFDGNPSALYWCPSSPFDSNRDVIPLIEAEIRGIKISIISYFDKFKAYFTSHTASFLHHMKAKY